MKKIVKFLFLVTLTFLLTACEKEYSVIFKDYDGTIISTVMVVESGNVAKPEDPTREGYTFKGWDMSLENITSDLELTAQYEINKYTVTFISDGSIVNIQTVEHGSDATKPIDPSKDGYTFEGWDKEYTNVTSDLEVTAQYKIKEYTVTFISDGETIDTQTIEHGKSATLPEDPSKDGYTFKGWVGEYTLVTQDSEVVASFDLNVYRVLFKDDNGYIIKEEYVSHGSDATKPEDPSKEGYTFEGWDKVYTNVTSDLEVTAQYKIKEYTVTFVSNGVTVDTQTIEHGKSATLPEDPSKDGHTFKGWFFDNETYNLQFNVNYPITSEVIIYSKFERDLLLVEFFDDNDELLRREYVLYGASATAPVAPPKAGHTFTGWNKEFLVVETNLTIKALYQINQYTVNFSNVGDNPVDDITVNYLTIINLPKPTKAGYVFIGWSDGVNSYEGSYQVKESITLTGNWVDAVNYQITFDTVGGNAINPIEILAYDYVSELPIPERIDYAFDGWSYLGNRVVLPFRYTYEENITLVANWRGLSAGVEYILENDEAIITKYVGSEEILILPDTIDGKPITQIQAQAFKDNQTLKDIKLGSFLTTVGNEAFSNMANLENIEFKNATQFFGHSTLRNSNKLRNITLSSEIAHELKYYFGNNFNYIPATLKTITYALGGSFIDKNLTQNYIRDIGIILAKDTIYINEGQFQNANLTSISIPNSVISIGGAAFSGCSSLTNIIIPNSVTSIGYSAFSGCSSLTNIIIPNSVTYIGYSAFSGCSNLAIFAKNSSKPFGWNNSWNSFNCPIIWGYIEIVEEDSVKYAVSSNGTAYVLGLVENPTLRNIIIPSAINGYIVDAIIDRAFQNLDITSIVIPNSVTSIGVSAFYGCSSLTSIIFEENSQLTEIRHNTFYKCSSLSSIVIPNDVTNIESYAFYGCSSLTSVLFEENSQLNKMENYIFSGCVSLKNMTIPNSVTHIEERAFGGCLSLTSVIFEEDSQLTIIGYATFAGCLSLTSIIIPNNVISIRSSAFSGCSSLTNIIIPNSVTSIGYSAFSGCSSLTNLIIPNSVTSIKDSAFSDCSSLTNIIIPNSVTNIGDSAFSGCSSLTFVTFEENSQLTEIEQAVFSSCSNLTNLVIPNSVTSIGDYSFSWCSNLKIIVIPNSVTSIGISAFSGCYNLTILAEISSKPVGWNSSWNSFNCPIIWGYIEIVEEDSVKYAVSSNGTACVLGLIENSTLRNIIILGAINGYIVDAITDKAFQNLDITSIVIPDSVTNIGYSAFYGCSQLTSIIFEENSQLTEIKDSAFYNCSSLTNIVIPNGVISIKSFAFSDCSNLTSVIFEENAQLTSIKQGAFSGCTNLTSIVIPNSVTNIEGEIFYGCWRLTAIFTEVSSKPAGWSSSWNSNRTVYWGGMWHYDVDGNPIPN